MNTTFSDITFNSIILHNVHKPGEIGPTPPTLSYEMTILDDAGRTLLQNRVSKVLAAGVGSIAMDVRDKTQGSCYTFAKQLIQATKKEFIGISAFIAHHHTTIHKNKRWPDGTLVIISGTLDKDKKRCLIIIKAEQQTGFTEIIEEGKITLSFLKNLILTPQSKLYKIGVFYETIAKSDGAVDELTAHVYDSNIKSDDERQAAKYFYSSFLGLVIPADSLQRTREFFTLTSEFIENNNATPARKVNLQDALFTYLKTDKSQTIETAEFADKYMLAGEADNYTNFMQRKEFPDSAIIKDTKNITRKLAHRRLNFSDGIKISAPSDVLSKKVTITNVTDTETTVIIQGVLMSQDK